MNWKEIHDMRGAGRKSNRTMFSVSSARTAPRFAANAWIALVLVAIVAALAGARGAALPLHFFRMQDVAVILLLVAALTATAYWRPPWRLPSRTPSARLVLALGSMLVLALWLGCHLLMHDYPLSRDEHMVLFDMSVFGNGRLAEPLALQWRPFAVDLVPAFLLNRAEPAALVSAYLPVNALLRLGFSRLADAALMNPLLVLAGGLALLDIARRLFGRDHRAIWVTMILYATSAQMLVTAMTTYAMTAHMALNLIWLAAFLRGGRKGHALAIAAGFLATGLHQLVFHPLFAAPFLLWRLAHGQWRIAIGHGVAYAAIIGLWMAYPMIASLHTGIAEVGAGTQDSFITDRLMPLLTNRDPNTLPYMTLNLVRFVAWQNFALLPLLVLSAPLALAWRSLAAPMLGGVALAILLIGFVLPYQGHGWGYRYLHPHLGVVALLAGLGFQRLKEKLGEAADGFVALLTVLTLALSIPYLLATTSQFVERHQRLDRLLAAQRSDFVLLDTEPVSASDNAWRDSAIDEVRNPPDLLERPLRFSSRSMDRARLVALCRRGTVTAVLQSDLVHIGFVAGPVPAMSPRLRSMLAAASQAVPGCFRRPAPA